MPQTFYIENDEEIISVIGRLRKSSSEENYFVFPKRALVLQSIVNLRLFQREAQKLGKRIVVVTQDEAGKNLAEKAGVETQSYSDDFSRAPHIELSAVPTEKKEIISPSAANIPRSQDIGSMDFYAAQSASVPKVGNEDASGTSLRIRNASPVKQTSLNSLRSIDESGSVKPQSTRSSAPLFNPNISMGDTRTPLSDKETVPNFSSAPKFAATTEKNAMREDRLKNFFAPAGQEERSVAGSSKPAMMAQPVQAPNRQSSPSRVPVTPKKVNHIFIILGGVTLLSLCGVALFLFLPKAEVHVIPRKIVRSVDQQFDGKSGNGGDIPVRIIEKEQAVTLTMDASGMSQGSAQKARGNVTIYNEFSAEPQSLVATTRFESTDGKIFRLIEGVTVPGMNNAQPGTVTAAVIADQTGSDYNIPPASFTIPGFKGSPKFSKFSAKSTKAMTGGGNATGSDISVIAKTDLDKAEREAKDKAKNEFLAAAKNELSPDEKILDEAIEIVPENQASLPVVGTAAASFDYQNTYKIRGFVFSEKSVKDKIEAKVTEGVSGIKFHPVFTAVTYGESLPNYSEGTLRLKAHASLSLESDINSDVLTDELAGKDESGINDVLAKHPEINKIQIQIKPQWFSSAIPTSKKRIMIFTDPGEE